MAIMMMMVMAIMMMTVMAIITLLMLIQMHGVDDIKTSFPRKTHMLYTNVFPSPTNSRTHTPIYLKERVKTCSKSP